MPIEATYSSNRFEFSGAITRNELLSMVENDRISVLQTSIAPEPDSLKLLNDELFKKRPDIELRFYGFYGAELDLSFCSKLTNVVRFSADCLTRVANIGSVTSMPLLERLALGVYELEDFGFLRDLSADLVSLSLFATRSKKPRIDHLARFKKLQRLSLQGQQRGIESVSALSNLREIVLRSISTEGLDYLEGLGKLLSVDIKLGGIKRFDSLIKVPKLRYLEIWQVRGFGTLDFLADLTELQYLFLQNLPNITSFPRLDRLTKLRRIYLDDLKRLRDFRGISFAPNLEEFIISSGMKQEISDLFPVLDMKSLRSSEGYFGSIRKNEMFRQELTARGIESAPYRDFVFDDL